MSSLQQSLPQEGSDVFSLTDKVLADKLTFVEEIGFGNWGSVWLCRPKTNPQSPSADDVTRLQDNKIAVKLVHRSKTPTTAARVRSLWNEMKIVREFKSDPHPSIIPFHSFIITPSYAMITMAYLPALITVEVDESRARTWFRFLLSAVEFLHKRGVVHNDIKPANILLSHKNVPVLVDFGFAERYDLASPKAFHSNLSYGTPEILIGRTPFEEYDGEQFSSKEDLERYWSRTLRGKWVGTWNDKMSPSAEQFLRRMLAPNADLRCTASEAMMDEYWRHSPPQVSHKRSVSHNSSLAFDKDLSRVLATPSRVKDNTDLSSPPGLGSPLRRVEDKLSPRHTLVKSKSQPKVNSSPASRLTIKKRVPAPVSDLSPIKASPPASPFSIARSRKTQNTTASPSPTFGRAGGRKPFGPLGASNANTPSHKENSHSSPAYSSGKKHLGERRVLGDVTDARRNAENISPIKVGLVPKVKSKPKDKVKERVRDWERERERLREMQKLEELERERDEQFERERVSHEQEVEDAVKEISATDQTEDTGRSSPTGSQFTVITVASSVPEEPFPRTPNDSSLSGIKHTFKRSIDKTLRMYHSSTLSSNKGIPTTSFDNVASPKVKSGRESWEAEALRNAKSSLPVVQDAARNDRVAADSQVDRLTIWMQNVEKVVEDARQTFASVNTNAPLPPLPLAPVSRRTSQVYSNRASRLPRRVPANQIFDEHGNSVGDQSMSFEKVSAPSGSNDASANILTQSTTNPVLTTPSRPRRATVSTRSPEPADKQKKVEENAYSPSSSKRREKSKSHSNLLQLRITPISALELEFQRSNAPSPTTFKRLSALVDRSLFVSTPGPSRTTMDLPRINVEEHRDLSLDDLNSSPLHVEPYPNRRPVNLNEPEPDPHVQRRIEGVYDRFLMATSGVKRLGKGYQSDNIGPVANSLGFDAHTDKAHRHRAFYSTRKAMPPPVSSADFQRQDDSVDEMGIMSRSGGLGGAGSPVPKDDSPTSSTFMRRAIKAIVPGKTISRRISRVYS
ncbi:hypothetical protein ONZ45_g266 [Pleurotus djamor]|nr:hypothetical protein ONZ45_g266 [Pleurotus djamor]